MIRAGAICQHHRMTISGIAAAVLMTTLGWPGALGQPGASAAPRAELPPELQRVLTDYEAAWRSRDPAALARLFADDRVVVPNACAPVNGRAEVERCYAGSGGPLSLRPIAFGIDGALGYIIGAYAPASGDADLGKFTLTLVKGADGRWLIVADMDRPYGR